MRLWWSYKSVPELSAFPENERKQVWAAANWQAYERWQSWASLIAVPLCVWGGSEFDSLLGYQNIWSIVGAGFGGLIHGCVVFWVARSCLINTIKHGNKE